MTKENTDLKKLEERRKASFKDTLVGSMDTQMDEGDMGSDEEIYDDDEMDGDEEGHCFSMGMSKEGKIDVRKPWNMSVIIKLVGRSIGYHFLLRRLQSMCRIQNPFTLINLSNDSLL